VTVADGEGSGVGEADRRDVGLADGCGSGVGVTSGMTVTAGCGSGVGVASEMAVTGGCVAAAIGVGRAVSVQVGTGCREDVGAPAGSGVLPQACSRKAAATTMTTLATINAIMREPRCLAM
jgi:hypothetical protein